MSFSNKDKAVIKSSPQFEEYGSRRIVTENFWRQTAKGKNGTRY